MKTIILKKKSILNQIIHIEIFTLYYFIISLIKVNSYFEINLTIIGNGTQPIIYYNKSNLKLFDKFNNYIIDKPDEIYVNDLFYDDTDDYYSVNNLKDEINNITIRWNHRIKDCNSMFYGLNTIINIDFSNFDTSDVTYMGYMFYGCSSLTSLNLNNFNTSKVNNMIYMFYECKNLVSLNISNFDTPKLNYMGRMFYGCNKLESINLINFNTSNIKYMGYIFYQCNSLKSLNINNFDTSSVTFLGYMFYGCKSLVSIDISNFDTSKVTHMGYMFYLCNKLESINLNNFNTSNLKYMGYMFYGCKLLVSLNISNFDTSKVTNMGAMFYGCAKLQSLNLNNFNTSKVISMGSMFSGCKSLVLINISNFNTSNVINMSYIFNGCNSLISLNLNNFETSNVNFMEYMFYGCNSLISLDLNNFNTSNVINMSYIFNGCNLLKSLNLNHFDTSKVINMEYMFYGCNSLESLNLNKFDTSKVTNMGNMFNGCNSLESLNLNNFDTSNVSNMEYMFYECNSLISLNLNNFDTSKLTKWSGMFYNFNSSLVYCINNEAMATRIQSDTTSDKQYSLEDSQNNCPKICYKDKYFYCLKDKCPDEYKFLILERKECIINCSYDQIYKYEYNNTCIDFIINDTNNNMYSEYLNIDENITSTELIELSEFTEFTELIDIDINTYLYNISDESEEKDSYFSDILSEKINNKFNIRYYILKELSILNDKSIILNDTQINEIIEKLKNILLSISYENLISEIKEGEDIIIENEKIILSITSTENQIYNINKNMSTIELGECENNLKREYNISYNNSLIIYKIDVLKDMKIPRIEYEVFYPLYNTHLIPLNLSVCANDKIKINIPIEIKEKDIDKYNISSNYFKDICYKTKSENGIYLTINDRKEEYINKDMNPCEENCEFEKYNIYNKKALCSCNVKTKFKLFSEINKNKKKRKR